MDRSSPPRATRPRWRGSRASGNTPKTQVAFSQDAGRTFGAPIRIDSATTLGRLGMVMPSADRVLVSSLERTADRRAGRAPRRAPRRPDERPRATSRPPRPTGRADSRVSRSAGPRLVAAWTDVRPNAADARAGRHAGASDEAARRAVAPRHRRVPPARRPVVGHVLHRLAVVPRARLRGDLPAHAERAGHGLRRHVRRRLPVPVLQPARRARHHHAGRSRARHRARRPADHRGGTAGRRPGAAGCRSDRGWSSRLRRRATG